jgi:hypothetical protein
MVRTSTKHQRRRVDCLPAPRLGCPACWYGSAGGMVMSAAEGYWDLLVFLALVAVGLMVLGVLARRL